MFTFKKLETNPHVVAVRYCAKSLPHYYTKPANGSWWRVFPKNWKEVHTLQMLCMHDEKAAPADGNGVFVRASVMERLTR